jgi:2-C-methyl-D-erythritol 4-phosphate cytidylyltransferase
MKVHAIVTAAGSGLRFANKTRNKLPKQFLKLHGYPVFLHSLLIFQKCRLINDILVTSSQTNFDLIYRAAVDNRITKLTHLVEGGKTRFESVRNAFMQINALPSDLILIHDAVRPNITTGFVNRIISSAKKYGNVIPGMRVSETVKKDKNGFVKETIDRSELWTVQTPQVFRYNFLHASYKKLRRRIDFTDESALVETAGYKVKLVEGLKGNIKITTPEDITLLSKLMK